MLPTGSLKDSCFHCLPCQPKLSHCAPRSFTVNSFLSCFFSSKCFWRWCRLGKKKKQPLPTGSRMLTQVTLCHYCNHSLIHSLFPEQYTGKKLCLLERCELFFLLLGLKSQITLNFTFTAG